MYPNISFFTCTMMYQCNWQLQSTDTRFTWKEKETLLSFGLFTWRIVVVWWKKKHGLTRRIFRVKSWTSSVYWGLKLSESEDERFWWFEKYVLKYIMFQRSRALVKHLTVVRVFWKHFIFPSVQSKWTVLSCACVFPAGDQRRRKVGIRENSVTPSPVPLFRCSSYETLVPTDTNSNLLALWIFWSPIMRFVCLFIKPR